MLWHLHTEGSILDGNMGGLLLMNQDVISSFPRLSNFFIQLWKTFLLFDWLYPSDTPAWRTVGQIGQNCKETSNLLWMSYLCLFTHIWWIWIHRSMHCDFLGSDGLQETHMDAFKPFNSKLVTLTRRGGFFTKITALAHGVAPPPSQPPPLRAALPSCSPKRVKLKCSKEYWDIFWWLYLSVSPPRVELHHESMTLIMTFGCPSTELWSMPVDKVYMPDAFCPAGPSLPGLRWTRQQWCHDQDNQGALRGCP